MISLQPGRIEGNPDLPLLSADEGKLRNVLILLDLVAKFGADPSQFITGVAVAVAPEGQGQDRHVIYGTLLDQRRRNSRRNPVVVGRQLVVQVDDAVFHVLSHIKPDDRQVEAGLDDGIDVLYALDFPQQFFHGLRDPGLHFLRRGPWIGDEDVNHRDEDLRLLLPGRNDNG